MHTIFDAYTLGSTLNYRLLLSFLLLFLPHFTGKIFCPLSYASYPPVNLKKDSDLHFGSLMTRFLDIVSSE